MLRAQNDEVLRRLEQQEQWFSELLEAVLQRRSASARGFLRQVSPLPANRSNSSNSTPLEAIEETSVLQVSPIPSGHSNSVTLQAHPRPTGCSRSEGTEVIVEAALAQLVKPATRTNSAGPQEPRLILRSMSSDRPHLPGALLPDGAKAALPAAGRQPTPETANAGVDPKTLDVLDLHEALLRRVVSMRGDNSPEPAVQYDMAEPRSPDVESRRVESQGSAKATANGSILPEPAEGPEEPERRAKGRVAWSEQVEGNNVECPQQEAPRAGLKLTRSSCRSFYEMRREVDEEILRTRCVSTVGALNKTYGEAPFHQREV